jgi:hypothetical protein
LKINVPRRCYSKKQLLYQRLETQLITHVTKDITIDFTHKVSAYLNVTRCSLITAPALDVFKASPSANNFV